MAGPELPHGTLNAARKIHFPSRQKKHMKHADSLLEEFLNKN